MINSDSPISSSVPSQDSSTAGVRMPSLESTDPSPLTPLPQGERGTGPSLIDEDGVERSRTVVLVEQAASLGMRYEDLDVFLRAGFAVEDIPKGPANRKSMLAYLRKRSVAPPKWVVVSGLWPETEKSDPAPIRRKKIRALYKAAVLLIRRELKRHEVDEFRSERTVFWDPIVEVCREMEISPSKLSSFCKELTGNSLIQVIDSVRVEGVLERMRAGVRSFIAEYTVRPHPASDTAARRPSPPLGRGDESARIGGMTAPQNAGGVPVPQCASLRMGLDKWAVWKLLKTSRRWPEFSQNSWAQGFGFSSYRRFYRACVSVFGKTPHQLEMGFIEEFLGEGDSSERIGTGTVPPRCWAGTAQPLSLEEIERQIQEIEAYEMFG